MRFQVGREIDLSEIKICKRPDGSDWLLGAGSFGQVSCCLSGIQGCSSGCHASHWSRPRYDTACGPMQVYKGLRRGVQEVAVKKLARNTAEDVWFKLLTNEIDVLKKVWSDGSSTSMAQTRRQPCSACELFTSMSKRLVLAQVSYDRNIVQYYGACLQDQASAMLVMEYMAVRWQCPPSPCSHADAHPNATL